MKIIFTHAGVERTLAKHADVQRALKAQPPTMTVAEALTKPWYLRVTHAGKPRTFKIASIAERDAVREAKDKLNNIGTDKFTQFLKSEDARQSVSIGDLWKDWQAAGLPFSKTKLRTKAAADALTKSIGRALPWWSDKAVATVNASMIEDYAAHRAPALTSADRELAAVSSLLQWSVLTGRIERNPVRVRARFAVVKQHCHQACPDDDETLHSILAYLFEPSSDLLRKLAGGTLAFCALTGLREGEPKFLKRIPVLGEIPRNTKLLEPGTIFPTRDGKLRMKVQRLKRGQNPFVTLHPAAESFLSSWCGWLTRNIEAIRELTGATDHKSIAALDETLFPLGTHDQTTLNRSLNMATDTLKLPHMVPHGFGRAFYVKVRRGDGLEDAAIGSELGQSSDEDLIRDIYGDPDDLVGSLMFDWLPDDCAPAWTLLSQTVVATIVNETKLLTA